MYNDNSNKEKIFLDTLPIGGFFELELFNRGHFHRDAICLNGDRFALEYILRARKYKKIYIPYYTCIVMLQPLVKLDINYEFYHINNKLEPTKLPRLKNNEAFLYTNYYGLKNEYSIKLSHHYGEHLIIDNAQAFFADSIPNIDTIYSARKFFGVSDGAYLYTNCKLDIDFEQDKSYNRMQHLLQRIDEGPEASYNIFIKNEFSLDDESIKIMSKLTEKILCSINYKEIIEKRISNYNYLHKYLASSNGLNFRLQNGDVPMIYPYYTNDSSLRKKLIDNKIFVAKYWPNVLEWCKEDSLEYNLTENLIPLPIDQRYNEQDMDRIIKLILKWK